MDFYNLDVIISVGYRVNSIRATQFRQWATQVLREFAVKGYMTVAEKLRAEGLIKGRAEGLLQAIDLGAALKFPEHAFEITSQVQHIHDPDTLETIKNAILTARDAAELLTLVKKL